MNYIKLMRIKHYIKNLLIFLPLIFSGLLLKQDKLIITIFGFICFSLMASSVYIINDIRDVEKDKKHKLKCKRPIAAGLISPKKAMLFMIFLLLIVVVISIVMKFNYVSILLMILYFVINICYSMGAKNIPLVDIILLVSGFVIRVLFGALLIDVSVSNWLYLTIISASFYLGFGKRRNEMLKSSKTRKVLKYYNKDFLDKNMNVFLTTTIVFYSLWTTDSAKKKKSNNLLIWTIPFLIIIFLKYSMDIEGDSDGDPVEVIVKDKILIGLGIIYGILLLAILYII